MEYVLYFGVGLAIGIPILIASMFITSFLGGGIDFGEVHVVLAKAVPLILVVDAIDLLPYGTFIALAVWWLGLMFIFGLDFWEARVLVLVNWGLNAVAGFLLMGLFHSLS